MSVCDLTDRNCVPCEGGVAPLSAAQAAAMMADLDEGWKLVEDTKLVRRFSFKGFAKAQATANMCAFVGDREGHHPDISFGWGYCEVAFTTHAIGGLSENDFICAAKIDRVLS